MVIEKLQDMYILYRRDICRNELASSPTSQVPSSATENTKKKKHKSEQLEKQ